MEDALLHSKKNEKYADLCVTPLWAILLIFVIFAFQNTSKKHSAEAPLGGLKGIPSRSDSFFSHWTKKINQ